MCGHACMYQYKGLYLLTSGTAGVLLKREKYPATHDLIYTFNVWNAAILVSGLDVIITYLCSDKSATNPYSRVPFIW